MVDAGYPLRIAQVPSLALHLGAEERGRRRLLLLQQALGVPRHPAISTGLDVGLGHGMVHQWLTTGW